MDTVYDRVFSSKSKDAAIQLLRHRKTQNWAILVCLQNVRMIKFKKFIDSYTLQNGSHTFLYLTLEDKKQETHIMWSEDKEWIENVKSALEMHIL